MIKEMTREEFNEIWEMMDRLDHLKDVKELLDSGAVASSVNIICNTSSLNYLKHHLVNTLLNMVNTEIVPLEEKVNNIQVKMLDV